MDQPVTPEFIMLCKEIVGEGKTESQWAEIESDDMFQTSNYIGGFDADEMEFCFSLYIGEDEFWFQIPLNQVRDIAEGRLRIISVRPAE